MSHLYFRKCLAPLVVVMTTFSSTFAAAKEPTTKMTSENGSPGGQDSWQVRPIESHVVNGVWIRTETVCPSQFDDQGACQGPYNFLYQIRSGQDGLELTWTDDGPIAEDSFGVLLCDGSRSSPPNMLCTRDLDPEGVDELNMDFVTSGDSLILDAPVVPRYNRLTFYIESSSLEAPGLMIRRPH